MGGRGRRRGERKGGTGEGIKVRVRVVHSITTPSKSCVVKYTRTLSNVGCAFCRR